MFKQVLYAVRVLDLATGWSAYAGRLLGDLGAEVIKIEPPNGDPSRGTPDFERLNANKYGCSMDLSTTHGVNQLMRLASTADVVIALPAAIDTDLLAASKPSLIVVLTPPEATADQSIAAAAGVGVALWDRRRTGEGCRIDVPPLTVPARKAPTGDSAREPVSTHLGDEQVESCTWHLSESPTHIRLPAPALGEHNEYVFGLIR
jgi:crotonobetainyl-CoA:carnitine CoA-transferase CaiB-like acyl-CoA transferase